MKKNLKIIVSIDGGGIRGLFPLQMLQYLEKIINEEYGTDSFRNKIEVYAGTSAGAIISAGLSLKENETYLYSVKDVFSIFEQRGEQLFDLSKTNGNSSNGLQLVLKRRFGNIKLRDIENDFLFVSFDTLTQKPFVFTKDLQKYKDLPLEVAIAACSAVPEFFPPIKLGNHLLVDGILTAKNPAKMVYQYVQDKYPEDEYLLLSFGTGNLKGELFDHFEEDVNRVNQFMEDESSKNNRLTYFRFQPEIIHADPHMDNATKQNIQALLKDGENFIDSNEDVFREIVRLWR